MMKKSFMGICHYIAFWNLACKKLPGGKATLIISQIFMDKTHTKTHIMMINITHKLIMILHIISTKRGNLGRAALPIFARLCEQDNYIACLSAGIVQGKCLIV